MNKNKKISFLLASFEEGGVEKVTINLALGLIEKGYQVEFVCFQKKGAFLEDIPPNIPIYDLKINRAIEGIPKLIKYFKKNLPDIFVSAKHYINVITIVAKKLAFVKTKVVVAGHGMYFQETSVLARMMRTLYKQADAVVAVSQGVAKNISTITGLFEEKISVIHNPVISHEFLKKYQTSVPIAKDSTEKMIVSVGRFSPEKDYLTLLKAFKQVTEHLPVRLVLVGDGPERHILERYINENNLDTHVDLPGFQTNPIPYLLSADVFVLSSVTEGLPTVLIESLYCGTPIVSTDCPSGPDEILEGGRYGVLVNVGDSDEMANEIIRVLNGEKSFPILKERAKDFTSEKALQHYIQLFNNL